MPRAEQRALCLSFYFLCPDTATSVPSGVHQLLETANSRSSPGASRFSHGNQSECLLPLPEDVRSAPLSTCPLHPRAGHQAARAFSVPLSLPKASQSSSRLALPQPIFLPVETVSKAFAGPPAFPLQPDPPRTSPVAYHGPCPLFSRDEGAEHSCSNSHLTIHGPCHVQ